MYLRMYYLYISRNIFFHELNRTLHKWCPLYKGRRKIDLILNYSLFITNQVNATIDKSFPHNQTYRFFFLWNFTKNSLTSTKCHNSKSIENFEIRITACAYVQPQSKFLLKSAAHFFSISFTESGLYNFINANLVWNVRFDRYRHHKFVIKVSKLSNDKRFIKELNRRTIQLNFFFQPRTNTVA